jgi:hypothetical protein
MGEYMPLEPVAISISSMDGGENSCENFPIREIHFSDQERTFEINTERNVKWLLSCTFQPLVVFKSNYRLQPP